jgi:hypothetical protein
MRKVSIDSSIQNQISAHPRLHRSRQGHMVSSTDLNTGRCPTTWPCESMAKMIIVMSIVIMTILNYHCYSHYHHYHHHDITFSSDVMIVGNSGNMNEYYIIILLYYIILLSTWSLLSPLLFLFDRENWCDRLERPGPWSSPSNVHVHTSMAAHIHPHPTSGRPYLSCLEIWVTWKRDENMSKHI